MPHVKEKIKYLFSIFLSPREIILIVGLLFLSFFFFLSFLYKASTLLMADRIMYKGSLTEGVIGMPRDTNPFKADNEVEKSLDALLYGTLIKRVHGNAFDLGLAQRVDVSSDGKTYKVTLRDNAKFSDGSPITQDDVIYSLNQIPLQKNYTVEKGDSNSLTFQLKKDPDPNFLQTFTYPIIKKNENFDSAYSTGLVTSSFFKIDSVQKDADGNVTAISLSRFDNGEDKIPYLKQYNLVYFKNDVDAYNAFQKKELDLLSGMPGTTISKIVDDKDIKLEVAQLPNNFAVFLNQNENDALRDPGLRKALSDIVDRESLTNQVLGGFGIPEHDILGRKGTTTPVSEVIDSLVSNRSSGFSFENGVLYMSTKKTPQNKSSAKSDNNSSSNKEKVPVTITITTIQNEELVDTANFLAGAWKKIGIDTKINVIDRKDLNGVVKDRDFEALLFGYSIRESKDYYSFFSGKERNYPKLNIANYTSKQVDKILDVLVDESDPARIADLTNQLSVEIAQDNPVIILYKPQFVFAHFLPYQIELPNTIKDDSERYSMIESWYTDTEKVFKIFNNKAFIDKLDMYLY